MAVVVVVVAVVAAVYAAAVVAAAAGTGAWRRAASHETRVPAGEASTTACGGRAAGTRSDGQEAAAAHFEAARTLHTLERRGRSRAGAGGRAAA